jgi:hypothetical protein
MPYKYMLEMVCDWIGAGWAIKGKNEVQEFYSKNKSNMILSNKARFSVEALIFGIEVATMARVKDMPADSPVLNAVFSEKALKRITLACKQIPQSPGYRLDGKGNWYLPEPKDPRI